MPSIFEIAEAIEAGQSLQLPTCHSICIYGGAKMGKTRLAATVARIPTVRSVHLFDGENGSDTILTMYKKDRVLTDEEMKKFSLYKIPDTKESPYFMETMLKVLTMTKVAHQICYMHGRVGCPLCAKIKDAKYDTFDMRGLDNRDWIIIDTASQLATSVMAYLCTGKPHGFKPGWDEYGPQGLMLSDMLSTVQAAKTNFIVITHELLVEGKDQLLDKEDKRYPLIGTKNFSMNAGKYFGTVIWMTRKLNKHAGMSSSTANSSTTIGSRLNIAVEKAANLDMAQILASTVTLGAHGEAPPSEGV